jgi:hypothetical protein
LVVDVPYGEALPVFQHILQLLSPGWACLGF